MFIVLGLLSPLYAETELLYEDFEGAAVGTLVNTLPGWSGNDEMVLSATLVDQGQSAGYTGTTSNWPTLSKDISYTPGAGEAYVFTGTLWSADTTGSYAHVQLFDSTVGGNERLHVALGYKELVIGYIDESGTYSDQARVPQLLTPMDFKVVVAGSSFDAYWKANGDSEWLDMGHIEGANCVPMSDFDLVQIIGHGGLAGGLDTIRLVVKPIIPTLYPGDANLDGKVDNDDAGILAANWQKTGGAIWGEGDFNGDENVDDKDATIMAVNWQYGVGQSAVPEPGIITLLCLGGLTLLLPARKN